MEPLTRFRDVDGEVRRCGRPKQDLQIHRQRDDGLFPSLPEAFNVLIRELMSLAINVELLKKGSGQKYIQGEQPEMDENVSIEVE